VLQKISPGPQKELTSKLKIIYHKKKNYKKTTIKNNKKKKTKNLPYNFALDVFSDK